MAVRIGMHRGWLASSALSSWLFAFEALGVAHAQSPDAAVQAPKAAESAPPASASGSAPAGEGTIPPQYLAPGQSTTPGAPPPQGAAPPAPNAAQQPAPHGQQQAPQAYPQAAYPQTAYPQQYPVYPPGYTPGGPYGAYPPPSNYPYGGEPYRDRDPVDEGARKHDGFYLRFKIGIGAGGTSYEERVREPGVSDVKTRGLAGNFELSVGGAVIENLILHGDIVLTAMSSKKRVDDVEDTSYDKLSSRIAMWGGGATYYFMPTNLYLTLVLAVAGLGEERYIDEEDTRSSYDFSSGTGFGTTLSVGKEWWVGRSGEWGLGAAITGAFATAPVRIGELSTRFYGNSVTINFSATYN